MCELCQRLSWYRFSTLCVVTWCLHIVRMGQYLQFHMYTILCSPLSCLESAAHLWGCFQIKPQGLQDWPGTRHLMNNREAWWTATICSSATSKKQTPWVDSECRRFGSDIGIAWTNMQRTPALGMPLNLIGSQPFFMTCFVELDVWCRVLFGCCLREGYSIEEHLALTIAMQSHKKHAHGTCCNVFVCSKEGLQGWQ